MYPGVPEVSVELSSLKYLAIPKSVKWRYPTYLHCLPFESNTKFYGFISLWIIF